MSGKLTTTLVVLIVIFIGGSYIYVINNPIDDNGKPNNQVCLFFIIMPIPKIATKGYIAILSYQQYVHGTYPVSKYNFLIKFFSVFIHHKNKVYKEYDHIF